MEIEFGKSKSMNKILREEINGHKEKEQREKNFEKRLNHIVEKISRKIGNWTVDYENLKKDFLEKPFLNFFQFIDAY